MTRRLLDLCLLAYPRPRRERDLAHLRDLALDLSDVHGVGWEALHLLRGGLAARWHDRHASRWRPRRVAAACVLAAVLVGMAIASTANEDVRVEVEQRTATGR